MDISTLIPAAVEPWFAILMVVASLVTSAISAAIGLGGGVLLIAIMGLGMPLAALVPVHGAVQLGSNVGRAFVQWRHITPWLLIWFGAGSILGAMVAGRLTLEVPETLWRLSLGIFILTITWLPKPKFGKTAKPIIFLNGAVGAILTMFFGATGPLVLAINAPHSGPRHSVVATHAAAMTLQHCLKILVFGFLGFAFTAWLPLMAAMIISGYIGTLIGSKLLDRLPEALFKILLRATITLLAIMLILQALI